MASGGLAVCQCLRRKKPVETCSSRSIRLTMYMYLYQSFCVMLCWYRTSIPCIRRCFGDIVPLHLVFIRTRTYDALVISYLYRVVEAGPERESLQGRGKASIPDSLHDVTRRTYRVTRQRKADVNFVKHRTVVATNRHPCTKMARHGRAAVLYHAPYTYSAIAFHRHHMSQWTTS